MFDTKGRSGVCSGHKVHADCIATVIIGAETRQAAALLLLCRRLMSTLMRQPENFFFFSNLKETFSFCETQYFVGSC